MSIHNPAPPAPPPASPTSAATDPPKPLPRRIGIGIDTARYGHYAAFLRDDLQPAAPELAFSENAKGYAELRARLQSIVAKYGPVAFHIRLDAAGQYADNLMHFLRGLGTPPSAESPAAFCLTLSCGDPQRNKNYRAALFGSQKSDPVEARAAARYALQEQPKPSTPLSDEMRQLRQVAGRLQAVVRQRTRLINQLHQLLVHAYPELATLVKDISVGWVLELLARYPTARFLAAASAKDLADIAYFPNQQAQPLLEAARNSVASLTGDAEAELVRDQVRQVRDTCTRQKRLENQLIQAYQRLPQANHLDTIKGLGPVTAAILTAFILDIQRFASPNQLVNYFGTMPIQEQSGVERNGTPRSAKRYVMSRRGNDLVRRYLWMAALSAVRFNPAVKPLYLRLVAKHPEHKAIAIGHAMRKLLHLVFAIWTSGKPFDPSHYTWEKPTHVPTTPTANPVPSVQPATAPPPTPTPVPVQEQAAGLMPATESAQKEVTAACEDSLSEPAISDETYLDFAHLKKQLPLSRVLDHLGLTERLRGSGPQRRGACPIHRADGRSRTFSVNLDENVFSCHQAACKAHGDVIDFWAALHRRTLREAALDLVRTFGLEPAPARTEKRNG